MCLGSKPTPVRTQKSNWCSSWIAFFLHWQSWLFDDDQLRTWKMKFQKIEAIFQNKLRIWTIQIAKQQQATQSVMYITIYKAGWPIGLRRHTQENFSLEISGTRMCPWVPIPLLSEVFKHCEVIHELKIMQNQKQFCFWKPSGKGPKAVQGPDLRALDRNFCYTRVCLGSKPTPVRTQKSNWCISWIALFCIDKIGCRWSINNFKNEIPKNWNDMSKQITYLNHSKWQNNSKQPKL